MQTRKKTLEWAILLFITLTMIACTDEADSVVTTNETLSNSDIVGTWALTEISYNSSGINISLSPAVGTYSLTLKFWENSKGQILSIDSGVTTVQDISWYIQGNTIILISDNNNSEHIRCEFNNQCLCMNYAYTTLTGEKVLALYIFTKEE